MTTATVTPETASQAHLPNPGWEEDINCRNAPTEIFFPVVETASAPGLDVIEEEPPYPTPEAKALCDRCPVRADCLAYALANDITYGTYGGMSAYQRDLIAKKRARKHCPGCGSDQIIREERDEVCLSCALSWNTGLLDF